MYRTCIFCSGSLGGNEAIETFPVGRQLAFDSWKGRLWAVCPACGRWNLAPIEERWEAVEEAEKQFRDARMRIHSENIGLAQMPDGTRLVRVGAAVPGELAAWRYGRQLLDRRKRYFIGGGVGAALTAAAYMGLSTMGAGIAIFTIGSALYERHKGQKIVYRLRGQSPIDTEGITVRRWHLEAINLAMSDNDIEVHVRDAHRESPGPWRDHARKDSNDIAVITGADARALLARSMVHVNRKGATRDGLDAATRILADAGSAERVLTKAARGGVALGKRAGHDPSLLNGPSALAVEMALNEESERRALEGELTALETAWREAEEIAAIADSLPGEAIVNRLLERLSLKG